MYFWISRCLLRTSTPCSQQDTISILGLNKSRRKLLYSCLEKFKRLQFWSIYCSALLFSACAHIATTLFQIPPVLLCCNIQKPGTVSLGGFLQFMVTKATQLHTHRDTNTGIQYVLQDLVRVSSSAIKYRSNIMLNSPVVFGMTLGLSNHQIRTSESSFMQQQNLLSSNTDVQSMLVIPAKPSDPPTFLI